MTPQAGTPAPSRCSSTAAAATWPTCSGPGGLVDEHRPGVRFRGKFSYPPTTHETAIEAPYRLIISPSVEGRWVHALEPVRPVGDVDHVELWHSRLGQLKTNAEGQQTTDEHDPGRRIVRAIWARDRDRMARSDWQDPTSSLPKHSNNDPFRMSLDPADRHMLVRQTAETVIANFRRVEPVPLAVDKLWLSSLGAWLDLRGQWDTRPYSHGSIRSILALDYIAPLGRDQHVEVAYPGYLYPLGHRAVLVKVTDRKMKDAAPSVAALYQRKFLVIGEPLRTYADRRDLPFLEMEVRPRVTPALDDPGTAQDIFFWPTVGASLSCSTFAVATRRCARCACRCPCCGCPSSTSTSH